MIGLIIFSVICFVIIWFVIFKVILIYQKKSLFKNITEKLEKQEKRIFNDGKEVNFKELLGKKEEKEEVVEEGKPVLENNTAFVGDIEKLNSPNVPEEVESTSKTTSSEDALKKPVKKKVKKLPTFEGDKFKLPEFEE